MRKPIQAAAWLASLCCIASLGGCTTQGDNASQQALDQGGHRVTDAIQQLEADVQNADAQHQDPVDRAFAPLDDTVDELNSDLNKGNGGNDGR